MKVLFVCSGNKKNGQAGTVVQNQANSLIQNGVKVEFFLISQKGMKGYLKSVKPLMKFIKQHNISIIHSHYSLSAFVTSFALIRLKNNSIKHIVSLMGSDAKLKGWKAKLTRFLNKKKWHVTIVKGQQMAKDLNLKRFEVIPNGVDINLVKPAKNIPENSPKKVLFAANPERASKNYALALEAFQNIDPKTALLEVVYNLPHDQVIEHINSTDVVLLTSQWEGSPNIIKEAMACNRPIVATKVGDVPWLIADLEGCFLVDADAQRVTEAILKALKYSETKGRERIKELGLTADSIAQKIISFYKY